MLLAQQTSLFETEAGKRLNVLVACEESQAVCKAFRALGHRAFSCDLQPCSGGHPEWHIVGDVLPIINGNCTFQTADTHTHTQAAPWDLLIAHPPCTYLSNAGACRMYPKQGEIDQERLKLAMEAKAFFLKIWNADCEKICIENPLPLSIVGLPEPHQKIQPFDFGEPWSKLTCLWRKNLPGLIPTEFVGEHRPYVSCGTSKNKGNKEKSGFSRAGGAQKVRSRTFRNIAWAMAEQWGGMILDERTEHQNDG